MYVDMRQGQALIHVLVGAYKAAFEDTEEPFKGFGAA
jgi:hypothetical protein